MKTNNTIFKSIVAVVFAFFIITGCKKEEEPIPPTVAPTENASQTTRASDQSNTENESNQAMDEANSAMGAVSTTRSVQSCGMTIDSTYKSIGKIILNYDGPACSGKKRTGSITVQLPYSNGVITTWSTAGATATLTFNAYKVTYVSNNKSLTLNGTHKVTNVNGGGWLQLYFGTPIVHKVRADMQLTFDDGTTRTWQSAAKRTITYNNTTEVLKSLSAGDTIISGHNNVAFWGVNRIGENFIIDMPTAFTYDINNPITNCIYKPLTGVIVHYGVAHSLTLTYGVDASGYATTSCPFGYKFSWTDGQGANQQIILAY
ncbi:MAG: hypothetical protein K8R85_06380 [Bacteroidetes bacterium]|nr:hypothetical protein [Bacteroidota bacterium]